MDSEHLTIIRSAVLDAVARELGVPGLAVFTYMSRRANRDGESWPSYQTIAKDLGIGRSTAIRYTRDLVDAGYLRVETRTGDRGPSSNVWVIPPEYRRTPPVEGAGGSVTVIPPSINLTPPPVSNRHHPSVKSGPKVDTEKKKKTLAGGDARFEEFWATYPRKVAKAYAREAWRKGRCDEQADVIIAKLATKPFAHTDAQYIPHPATWLNAQRWLDEDPAVADDSGPKKNGRFVAG